MPEIADRIAIRQRPAGRPAMLQTWRRLLFLHQAVDPAVLTGQLPPELEVDTFDGRAWIGVIPFGMEHIRHPRLPEVPGLRSTLELNVRTYVAHRGVPGVWFFSLDASNAFVVHGARRLFHLPYYRAVMEEKRRGNEIAYRSRRTHSGAPALDLSAVWSVGHTLPEAPPSSLEFFLTERYCLYTAHHRRLYRGRIFHPPWPLQSARLLELHSSMLAPLGLRHDDSPLAHYADLLEVEIFPLEIVGEVEAGWRIGSR